MSFSSINAVGPHEINESPHNNQKRNCPEAISSNGSNRRLHINNIPKSVISYCIIRAFLDFSSIASFSKSSRLGRIIVRETMDKWQSEGLKLNAKQIRCLMRYSKQQAKENQNLKELILNKVKDAYHLILSTGWPLHFSGFTAGVTIELLRPCSHLQSINLRGNKIESNLLNCISASSSTLRHINLNLPSSTSEGWQIQFQEILQKCTFLHTVKLRNCGISDETLLVLSKCTHITHLNLSLNRGMSDNALKNLLESLPGLTALDLNNNSNLGIIRPFSTFFETLTEPFPNLRALNISMIYLNKKNADHITKIFPNLTALNIRSTILECEDICSIIKQLPSLTDISYNLDSQEEEEQAFKTLIQHCSNLRKINLIHNSLTDHSISFLAKACPNLTEINTGVSVETQMGLLALAREFRFLKCFNICGSSSLDFNILQQFVKQSQNLRKIKIHSSYSEILEKQLLSINPNLTVIFTDVKWGPVKEIAHNS